MLVTATIRQILSNGLWLTFLNYFAGTVDMFHLDNIYDYNEIKEHFTIGQKVVFKKFKNFIEFYIHIFLFFKVKARILYVDFENKIIGLTLKSNLLSFEPYPFNVTVGDIFENATVKRVDRGIGLAIELPTKDRQPAYVHVFILSLNDIFRYSFYSIYAIDTSN
jgi:rRNA biogenesis protein RRP5